MVSSTESDLGRHAAKHARSPHPRCHPGVHSSQPSPDLRLGCSLTLRRPLNCRLRCSSRYCIHHYWWSDRQRQQLAHTLTLPGSPTSPGSARFACLLSVELVEQTAAPWRADRRSGAFPDFVSANPLSRSLLNVDCSVRLRDCQAPGPRQLLLTPCPRGQLLACAYGVTTGFQARPWLPAVPVPHSALDSGRDCVQPCRLRTHAVIVDDPCVLALPCRSARGLFVVHLFPARGSASTPTADFGSRHRPGTIPLSTNQALAQGDGPCGHRLSPRHRSTMPAVPTAHGSAIRTMKVAMRDCAALKRRFCSASPFRHVAGTFFGCTTRCGTTGEVVNAGGRSGCELGRVATDTRSR